MAAYNGQALSNAEMDSTEDSQALYLSDYVIGCTFPQCVCVTEGSYLSKSVQISKGDVVLVNSCDHEQVTLSYRDETSQSWAEITVSLDFPHKFKVLPPKDVNTESRAVSMVMYPTIADLLLDCPTHFEATTSYDDPYLPGMSVKAGDSFWFQKVVRDTKDGLERLKVYDERGNSLMLSSDCRGNFSPVADENLYTLRELVKLAPVQRRLQLVIEEQPYESLVPRPIKTTEAGDEYTEVSKPARPSVKSTTSSSSSGSSTGEHASSSNQLPLNFTGAIHLLKPEPVVSVSPYNDLATLWAIPASANLKVRNYHHNDYEIPAPRASSSRPSVPLPLSMDDQCPKFQAPVVPPLLQPLIPVNINTFVDIYSTSFPVKAKILNTSEADPFYQKVLKGIDDVNIYRMEEARRLCVKNVKNDDVYSLSHDLKLSFIEYPDKFSRISQLLHLPIGSQITVLEDIAADFPKPFSLRFGDIIRITSNTPYFVKLKHSTRDCEILKCEKIDPEGDEHTKLRLPMDLDISMVMATDSNNRKMLSLQDLLRGKIPLPTQNVASVPEDSNDETLKKLPVELKILKSIKETCLVLAPVNPPKDFLDGCFKIVKAPKPAASGKSSVDETCKKGASASSDLGSCSSQELEEPLTNIGVPLHTGIIMGFRDRVSLFELDVAASDADYVRMPIEKITLSQFEERERMRKLTMDYEDVGFGSTSTLDDSGSEGAMSRANSTGLLERKQKSTKMDKVRRLSRALNPKHWRHSKAEPEPLPHPSAMGLMALAARPHEGAVNDYHQQDLDSGATAKRDSLKGESACAAAASTSSEEEVTENFYEDVEIGPLKSATFTNQPARQTGAFSGPQHRSMPLPRVPASLFTRKSTAKERGKSDSATSGQDDTKQSASTSKEGNGDTKPANVMYDVPKAMAKTKAWATNLGNNISNKFHTLHRYDVPKNNKVKEKLPDKEPPSTAKTTPVQKGPPPPRPPLPPPFKAKKPENAEQVSTGTEQISTGTEKMSPGSEEMGTNSEQSPVPPMRRKGSKPTSPVQDSTTESEAKSNDIWPAHTTVSKSKSLDDSLTLTLSTTGKIETPKPKPRGLKKLASTPEEGQTSPQPSSNGRERPPRSLDSDPSVKSPVKSDDNANNNPEPTSQTVAKESSRPRLPPKPRISTQTTV